MPILTSTLVTLLALSLCTLPTDAFRRPMRTLDDTPDAAIARDLFGPVSVTPAPTSALRAHHHPRIVFDSARWRRILDQYARHYHRPASWAGHQSFRSLVRGPTSPFIARMAALDTSAYMGDELDLAQWTPERLATLQPLADQMMSLVDIDSQALFMCVFWSKVNIRMPHGQTFIEGDPLPTCKKAMVAWAKVLLAHRAFNCAGRCPSGEGAARAYLWDHSRNFVVSSDSFTLGFSLAFAYDVLYEELSLSDRRTIRSALAMLVLKKQSWGNTAESTTASPNGFLHPHRIFSNWAPYHSALYLTNLAIEGETDFDIYTQAVLDAEGEQGFNTGLDFRFTAMLDAFLKHSIYPDGSTFEDGYTYFISMFQGSLALIAATRRGWNFLDTPRFRNFAHNAMQMTEPWHCGALMGHGSGGGIMFPTYIALFRYVYPAGVLPAMMWRNRMGDSFVDNSPCRIDWHQHMMAFTILADEHDESVTTAISPEFLTHEQREKLPRGFFAPRRGLVIMRNAWTEQAAYVHFDARPDAFIVGHDNADRGVFTFSALRQTWLTDLPAWNHNVDSRKHSVMHVDGLAQGEFRTPAARMIKVVDYGSVAIAAADLAYAYNVHWYQSPQKPPVVRKIVTYFPNGTETKSVATWTEKEEGDPRSFGWPQGDDGADLGMTRPEFNIWGDTDFGFNGLFMWKRDYRPRTTYLSRAVRSVTLVRSSTMPGYLLVSDSFESVEDSEHDFESYLILHDDVKIDKEASSCKEQSCLIVLMEKNGEKRVDVHAMTKDDVALSYRFETFQTEALHSRVVIKGVAFKRFELWLGVNAHPVGIRSAFSIKEGEGLDRSVEVRYNGDVKHFELARGTFAMAEKHNGDQSEKNAARKRRSQRRGRFEQFSDDTPNFSETTDMVHHAGLQVTTAQDSYLDNRSDHSEDFSPHSRVADRMRDPSISVSDCGQRPSLNDSNGQLQQALRTPMCNASALSRGREMETRWSSGKEGTPDTTESAMLSGPLRKWMSRVSRLGLLAWDRTRIGTDG